MFQKITPLTLRGCRKPQYYGEREVQELYNMMEKLEKDGSVIKPARGATAAASIGLLWAKSRLIFRVMLLYRKPSGKKMFLSAR